RLPVATEYDLGSFREPLAHGVGAVAQDFAIAAIDEDGEAPRGLSGADVSPPVADHIASAEVDAALVRGGDQHTRLRLVAGRRPSAAHHDRIEDAIAIQEDGPRFSSARRHRGVPMWSSRPGAWDVTPGSATRPPETPRRGA